MLRLLVVDDHQAARDLLQIILGGEYEVKTAGTGAEALDLIGHWEPDGVLTDQRMPGMTGLGLGRALGKRPHVPKLILLSACLTQEMTEAARRLGFAACISKPFDLEELKAVVKSVLGST